MSLFFKENQLKLDEEVKKLQIMIHKQMSLVSSEHSVAEKDLKDIVKETIKAYVAEAGSTLSHLIKESHETLIFEFEKSVCQQVVNAPTILKLKEKSPSSSTAKKKSRGKKSR